jgi:flavin reductase (DIM6/NTAB) family NADH-FMN oxidoreductase RutF
MHFRKGKEKVPTSSEAPVNLLENVAFPVVLMTVGTATSLKTIVTTFSYASLMPLRIAQCFPAASGTAKMVLERNRFTVSIAAHEQIDLVKSLSKSPTAAEAAMPEENGLAKFPGGEEIYYFAHSLLAFDCQVEESFQSNDYMVIVSRVMGYQKGDGLKPLVRFAHGYASIDDTIFSDDSYPV